MLVIGASDIVDADGNILIVEEYLGGLTDELESMTNDFFTARQSEVGKLGKVSRFAILFGLVGRIYKTQSLESRANAKQLFQNVSEMWDKDLEGKSNAS